MSDNGGVTIGSCLGALGLCAGVLSGCSSPVTLLTIGAYEAERAPARDYAYCVTVGADNVRKDGHRHEWSDTPLPQTLALRADGRAFAVARVDELYKGLRIRSSSAKVDLAQSTATLRLDVCQQKTVSGAFVMRKLADVQAGSLLAVTRTAAEVAGGAGLVAMGADRGWRATFTADADKSTDLAVVAIDGTGGAVTQLVAHDVDGDCADDLLAVVNDGVPQVWTSASDGKPTRVANRVADVPIPSALALGDLKHDGYADLALTTGEGVVVLSSEQKASYLSEVRNAVSPQVPMPGKTIVIGDLDNDDRLDALVGVGGERIYFLRGNNDGTFQSPVAVSDTLDPSLVVLHDLDGDGRLDVVVAAHAAGGAGVRVLTNDGLGTTGSLVDRSMSLVPANIPDDVTGLVFADVDGDCRDELIVFGPVGAPTIYDVRTGGALAVRETIGTAPAQALVAADLDGDGAAEIAFVTNSQVQIWSRTP